MLFRSQTDEWKQRYKLRAGIEGTHSGAKRKVEVGKLRVRGKPSVSNVVLLKLTGWNIFRAAAAMIRKGKRPIKGQKATSTTDILVWLTTFGLRLLDLTGLLHPQRPHPMPAPTLLAA